MSKKLTIKYISNNEYTRELFHASEDDSGYDVFAAETKTLFPQTTNSIELELKMVISKGYFGKISPRSGLLKKHFITCDAGVVDADYRGSACVLTVNHHKENLYTVRIGDRIAQIVFSKNTM